MIRKNITNIVSRIFWKAYGIICPQKYNAYNRILCEQLWMKHYSSKMDMFRRLKMELANDKTERKADYVRQMKNIFQKEEIDATGFYIYPFEPTRMREIPNGSMLICSLTADYETVLKSKLSDVISKWNGIDNSELAHVETKMTKAIEFLASRICNKLNSKDSPRAHQLHEYFLNMLNRTPQSLDEAIQKLLFYNAIFWQANHWHIGLGRLDLILYPYYKADLENHVLTQYKAREMLVEMLRILNRDVLMKSKTLAGDTGQYIMLSGINSQGENIENELTFLILDIFKSYKQPDPKLIFRVNSQTSIKLWDKVVRCIVSGNGSPLLMNEDLIMKRMVEFGYSADDVWQLGTSACWEPLIIGKSFDQNNSLPTIVALRPLEDLIMRNECYDSFEQFLDAYKKQLSLYIEQKIYDIRFDVSPLMTLFFDDCLKKGKDISEGGASYSLHGIQVVSLPNTINSLLNIKQFVFEMRLLNLKQCADIIISNYNGYEDFHQLFKNSGKNVYGSTNKDVIDITNDLHTYVGNEVSKHKMNNKKLKVGFSSPTYIMCVNQVGASLDGRKNGDPFAVHISPVNSSIDICEILDFASSLNYQGNRINGNVVDFIIPTNYAEKGDKLRDLLIASFEKGIYELQLNVLDYKTLVDAKAHPEKYPHLIVRVWGFSAYFNDLPEDYKDNLIDRAKMYA